MFGGAVHAPPWAARGVGAVLVVYLVLGLAQVVVGIPLQPGDEVHHVSYVAAIDEGTLPRPEDGTDPELSTLTGREPAEVNWVSTHPPAVYVALWPAMRLGRAIGGQEAAVTAMRLMNVVFGAVAVLGTAMLAAELRPRDKILPVLAAAIVGLWPTVTLFFGLVFLEAGSTAVATVLILFASRIVIRGPTTARLVTITVAAGVGAWTRMNVLPVVAFAVALVVVGAYRHIEGSTTARVVRAIAVGALPLAAGATIVLWLLHNQSLYGDISGLEHIRALMGGVPRAVSPLSFPLDLDAVGAFLALLAFGYGSPDLVGPIEIAVMSALYVLFAVAGLVGLVRLAVRRLQKGPLLFGHRDAREVQIVWAANLVLVAVLAYGIARHWSAGGNPHGRYIFPALPVLGVMAACSLRWMRGRAGVVIPAVVIGALGLVGSLLLLRLGALSAAWPTSDEAAAVAVSPVVPLASLESIAMTALVAVLTLWLVVVYLRTARCDPDESAPGSQPERNQVASGTTDLPRAAEC